MASIGHRPTVKLGLHPWYPTAQLERGGGSIGLHPARLPPFTASLASRYRCRPSPLVRLSRTPTTTAAPPRPARSADGGPIPTRTPAASGREPHRAVPVFTDHRSLE